MHLYFLTVVSNGMNHSPPTLNGAPSPPQRFSNGPASSSSSSLTNQQLPATCGARQLSKLKRFLTTLQQFGNDISPEIGEKVRTLVLALVVSIKTPKSAKTAETVDLCLVMTVFVNLSYFKRGRLQLPEFSASRLAGEFWELKFTHLKVAQIVKH